MADLIAKIMADIIAIMVWLILLPLVLFGYVYIALADVIAIFYGRSYCHVVVVDVVTTYYCYLPILQDGRCYCLCICGRWKTTNYLIVILADVIAMVADEMATQGGLYLADVNAMVADGILPLVSLILDLVLRC